MVKTRKLFLRSLRHWGAGGMLGAMWMNSCVMPAIAGPAALRRPDTAPVLERFLISAVGFSGATGLRPPHHASVAAHASPAQATNAALLAAAGRVNMGRWLQRQTPSARAALLHAAANPRLHAIWNDIFSPSRKQRILAARQLRLVKGRPADWLLDALLLDDSRAVRLTAMNAFWKRPPDAQGTADLYWLAVDTRPEAAMAFDAADRAWTLDPSPPAFVMIRFHGQVEPRTKQAGNEYFFSASDARRAADILIHWKPASLAAFFVAATVHDDTALTPNVLPYSPPPEAHWPMVDRWDFLRLISRCRPMGALPFFLRMMDRKQGQKMESLDWQGRRYYYNRSTDPLAMLLLTAGINPIHLGVVLTGERSKVTRQWAALSRRAQQHAMRVANVWCRSHGIRGAAGPYPKAIFGRKGIGKFEVNPSVMDLPALKLGLICFLCWAKTLPGNQAAALCRWGCDPKHIEAVSQAFAARYRTRLLGLRLIGGSTNPNAERILAHNIDSSSPTVELMAMNLFWHMPGSPAVLAALWKLATTPTPVAERKMRSGGVWSVRFNGRFIHVARRIEPQGGRAREIGQNSHLAVSLLVHLNRAFVAQQLLALLSGLQQGHGGLLEIAGEHPRRYRFVLANIHELFRRCAVAPATPALWAAIGSRGRALVYRRAAATGQGETAHLRYVGCRTLPLLILCEALKQKAASFGLHRGAALAAGHYFDWYSRGRSALTAGCQKMLAYGKLHAVAR